MVLVIMITPAAPAAPPAPNPVTALVMCYRQLGAAMIMIVIMGRMAFRSQTRGCRH
jgi:hypothetical protein